MLLLLWRRYRIFEGIEDIARKLDKAGMASLV